MTNGTTADADEVMQNFNDILNGVSDGTKDISVAALTAAGTATFNGSVTLGNASGDDITLTGSLASSIPVKTADTYNIGSAALGILSVYFGNNSNSVRVMASASASADWTMTLPPAAGTRGQALYDSDGSGTLGWVHAQMDIHSVSSADYTVLDTDGYRTIYVTTGSTDRTVTLPTASANTDRILTVKKADSGTGKVTVDGEGSETIDGVASVDLFKQYEAITLQCDGSGWFIINAVWANGTYDPTISATTNLDSTPNPDLFHFERTSKDRVMLWGRVTVDPTSGGPTATVFKADLPIASNFSDADHVSGLGLIKKSGTYDTAQITGDPTNDLVAFEWNASGTGSEDMYFEAHYQIV